MLHICVFHVVCLRPCFVWVSCQEGMGQMQWHDTQVKHTCVHVEMNRTALLYDLFTHFSLTVVGKNGPEWPWRQFGDVSALGRNWVWLQCRRLFLRSFGSPRSSAGRPTSQTPERLPHWPGMGTDVMATKQQVFKEPRAARAGRRHGRANAAAVRS